MKRTVKMKKCCMLCEHRYDDGSNEKCDLVRNPESHLTTPYKTFCEKFELDDVWETNRNKDFIEILEKYENTVIFPLHYKSITAATKTNGATMKIEIPTNIIGTDARDERNWSLFVVAFRKSDIERSNKT